MIHRTLPGYQRCERDAPGGGGDDDRPDEDNLETLCGSAERGTALAHLVEEITKSRGALWAIGAPFGLPVEVLDDGMSWPALLRWVRRWDEHAGYDLGLRALIAAVGAAESWRTTDHAAVARDDRFRREGFQYW